MVDLLVVDCIKDSIGSSIVFWDNLNLRHEGKILACSDEYLKYYDIHKEKEKFVKLENIMECEL